MYRKFFLLSAFLMGVALSYSGENKILEVGDHVPEFDLLDQDSMRFSTEQFSGKQHMVIYFYPAAMTGGCTKQACAYRDDLEEIKKLGAVVIGISGDTPGALKLFQKAHQLNFPLLSDPIGGVASIFGVPIKLGEKSIEREIDGDLFSLTRTATSSRWTLIVDKSGKLVYKAIKVDAANDSKAVLAELKKLP